MVQFSGPRTKPLRFSRVHHPLMSTPCIIPVSHKPHKSGYVQIARRYGPKRGKDKLHRIVYRARHGEHSIPAGWEVHHICNVRSCCNPRHLRCLSRLDHLRVTNTMRNAARLEEARCYWEIHQSSRRVTGAELAERFGVSQTNGSRWIRTWKAEGAALAA